MFCTQFLFYCTQPQDIITHAQKWLFVHTVGTNKSPKQREIYVQYEVV